jgi:hypothetical protein
MDQSPAAFFYKADATDNGYRGATGFRGFGDFSIDLLLLTDSGGGEETLLPTCVLCHVSRCIAHYVIDGLMHNDVVKSDIHSTDTGGYSEVLFGVMHL